MHTSAETHLEALARPENHRTAVGQQMATASRAHIDPIELVVRLPDSWREPRVGVSRMEPVFHVVRYSGPLPGTAMLGDYSLDRLAEGPIRSVIAQATRGARPGMTTHLALSCVRDQIRALFDAARSWAPGAVYRLSVRTDRVGTIQSLEIEGSPDLEGRAFLPRELLELGAEDGPIVDARRPPVFAATLSDSSSPAQVETSILTSGAWTIRVRIEHDPRRA